MITDESQLSESGGSGGGIEHAPVRRRSVLRSAALAGVALGAGVGAGVGGPAAAATGTGAGDPAAAGATGTGGPAATAAGSGDPAPAAAGAGPVTPDGAPLLSEPYLLDPAPGRIRVAWCTESRGQTQVVLVGTAVAGMTGEQLVDAATGDRCGGTGADGQGRWRRHAATSRQLTLTREDAESTVAGRSWPATPQPREVWHHLADVDRLDAGRHPYRVVSVDAAGHATITAAYTLAGGRTAQQPVRLLLTSDHQLKAMTPANLELAAQTIGTELDGILMAGDSVNVPDRASEWFDSTAGTAFFPNLTGRASRTLGARTYRGAAFLQHSPLFQSIGNHEVMGRWSDQATLKTQFDDAQPTEVAERLWAQTTPAGVRREDWIVAHSWNTTTYEQLFPYPRSAEGGPRWYSTTIGDVFLINLFVASMWRTPATTGRGKFQEASTALGDENSWGYGEFVFEPIRRDSRQYQWLERTLRSGQARSARYRVVMFHHPSHGLGMNSVPAFTDPVQAKILDSTTGQLTAVSYGYPLADDHVLRDVEPLLNDSGVHLVLNGHSHIWNRFRNAAGVHWLETSNVGDTLGAFDASSGVSRSVPDSPDLVRQGDPGRLTPVVPSVAPLAGRDGAPLPYLASSTVTAFSVLDSARGTVASYRFDTEHPEIAPVLFDEFPLA